MVSDFINSTIFWEYDVSTLNVEEWPEFIVKQVFNRNVTGQPAAIPALIDHYGRERVEAILRAEEWLTSEGIQTALHYFPHLRNAHFKANRRINRRRRQLASVGEHNPKL